MRPNQFNLPPLESVAVPTHTMATSENKRVQADETITQNVLPRDLLPGDVVSPAGSEDRISAFDAALVERVSDETVTLFRPYATTPNIVYGREPGVIPLIWPNGTRFAGPAPCTSSGGGTARLADGPPGLARIARSNRNP